MATSKNHLQWRNHHNKENLKKKREKINKNILIMKQFEKQVDQDVQKIL